MHNVVKHANAKNVLLQVQTSYGTGMVIISIEDDGKGMDLEQAKNKGGLGMRSLYSRVQNLNGSIVIQSVENEGTSVYITLYPKAL